MKKIHWLLAIIIILLLVLGAFLLGKESKDNKKETIKVSQTSSKAKKSSKSKNLSRKENIAKLDYNTITPMQTNGSSNCILWTTQSSKRTMGRCIFQFTCT